MKKPCHSDLPLVSPELALFTLRGKTFGQWMAQVSKVALIIKKQRQSH